MFRRASFEKIWRHRTAAFSANEKSERRFDSTKFHIECMYVCMYVYIYIYKLYGVFHKVLYEVF